MVREVSKDEFDKFIEGKGAEVSIGYNRWPKVTLFRNTSGIVIGKIIGSVYILYNELEKVIYADRT